MPKFFQTEIAAYDGDKTGFQNVKFKKNDFRNSSAAEAGTVIEFIPVHIRNPPVIQFIAYITNLSERYGVRFATEQPFGRTNPYYIWQSNNRSINVAIDIPSSGISSGLDNLNSLSWFLSALYPTYKDSVNATSVAASPLFRVRYSNLICSSTNNGQGLLCAIDGVNVTHDVAKGFIYVNPKNVGSSFANAAGHVVAGAGFQDSIGEGKRFLIPKVIKLSMNLNVVHDHALGWDYHTGMFRGGRSAPSFPHDIGLVRDPSDVPMGGATVMETTTSNAPDGSPDNQQARGDIDSMTEASGGGAGGGGTQ
jgi:hypothetical protein